MKRLLGPLVAIVASVVTLGGQTAAPAVSLPTGASTLGWDQQAASLAVAQQQVYRLYKDGVQVGRIVATCTTPTATTPAGMFPCTTPFPADAPGVTHSITLTAALADGTMETPPSVAYSYVYVVTPVTPRNLRNSK